MGAGASVQEVRDFSSKEIASVISSSKSIEEEEDEEFWKELVQLVENEDINGAKIVNICSSDKKTLLLQEKLEKSVSMNDCERRNLLKRIESFKEDVVKTNVERTEGFEMRGISVKLLRAIEKEALRINEDKSFWTIGAISACLVGNHEILLPDSDESKRFKNIDPESTLTYEDADSLGSSLIDILQRSYQTSPHPRLGYRYQEVVSKATAFVSFAYSSNFFDLVDALETIMIDENDLNENTTFFWFDLFVNDQWRALSHDFLWWSSTFKEAIKEIGHTICIFHPWENPLPLTRVWCLYEIFCSERLSIALSSHEVDSFYEALRKDSSRISRALGTIDLENASSYLKEDKEKIFEAVKQGAGFHKFNMLVKGLLRDWFHDVARDLVDDALLKTTSEDRDNDAGISIPMIKDEESLVDLERVATLLESQGRFKDAIDMYNVALDGFEKSKGPKHELTLQCRMHLALAYNRLDRVEDAKTQFEVVYEGFMETKGSSNENTLDALTNLANTICELEGDLSVACAYYEEALQGYEKIRKDHPASCVIMSNLANLFESQEKYEEALKYYDWALTQKRSTLGRNDPSTLNTLSNYAGLLHDTEQLDKAEEMYMEALVGREETLGADHLDTLKVVNNYALLLEDKKELRKAKLYYERALKGKEAILGPDHPSVENTRNNLQMCIENLTEETDGNGIGYLKKETSSVKTRRDDAGNILYE